MKRRRGPRRNEYLLWALRESLKLENLREQLQSCHLPIHDKSANVSPCSPDSRMWGRSEAQIRGRAGLAGCASTSSGDSASGLQLVGKLENPSLTAALVMMLRHRAMAWENAIRHAEIDDSAQASLEYTRDRLFDMLTPDMIEELATCWLNCLKIGAGP